MWRDAIVIAVGGLAVVAVVLAAEPRKRYQVAVLLGVGGYALAVDIAFVWWLSAVVCF